MIIMKFTSPISLAEIKELLSDLELEMPSDLTQIFSGANSLKLAQEGDVTFFHHARYSQDLMSTKASLCFMSREKNGQFSIPSALSIVYSEKPQEAFIKLLHAFLPVRKVIPLRHPAAIIDPEAQVHSLARIEEGAVVQSGAVVGARTTIGPYAFIGQAVLIGEDCVIESHCSIQNARLGNRIHVKPGARIGQSGFGFLSTDQSIPLDIPHLGHVLIDDDVEIGSNVTIDRGTFSDTHIQKGCRIDNLVQIAHNVIIGENVIIAAQCGFSGSITIGKNSVIGGQVGAVGHIEIAEGTQIAAKSGVMRSTKPHQVIAGYPAVPIEKWRKMVIKSWK
jgi:UDP-3-O-[3-hydroxymyristoyl] glucosamine N-acyltransferase